MGTQISEKNIQADRKYKTSVTPTESRETQIQKINDRVWVLTQPFGDVADKVNGEIGESILKIKMVVYKFKDGSLFIHNPIAPTQECVNLFKENIKGDIKYVALGGTTPEHTYFAQDFCAKLCPEVPSVWIIPSLRDKIKSGQNQFFDDLTKQQKINIISNGQSWDDEVEAKLFSVTPDFGEAHFLLKEEKIVVTTDIAFGIRGKEKESFLGQLLGIRADTLCPIVARTGWIVASIQKFSLEPRTKVIDFFVDVCQWDFQHVIGSHLDMFMDIGKQEYIRMVRENFGKNLV